MFVLCFEKFSGVDARMNVRLVLSIAKCEYSASSVVRNKRVKTVSSAYGPGVSSELTSSCVNPFLRSGEEGLDRPESREVEELLHYSCFMPEEHEMAGHEQHNFIRISWGRRHDKVKLANHIPRD